MTPSIPYEFGTDYAFEDLFPDAASFAGVKAVFAPMSHRYLCFGKSGASFAAGLASKTPWVICIGTTTAWKATDRGRMLNLVRLTTSHQATSQFTATAQERLDYAQWTDAVAVADVFEVVGAPHVKDDLGMGQHPLMLAHDKVMALTAERLPIVAALRGYRIRLVDLPPLPVGVALGTVVPASIGVEEGRAIMRLVRELERSGKLPQLVKAMNMASNGGACVCEGCDFRDKDAGLFDAHHRRPLHVGVQVTTPASMSVLCPTCHRVVHRLAKKPHLPIEIADLRTWHAGRAVAALKEAAD